MAPTSANAVNAHPVYKTDTIDLLEVIVASLRFPVTIETVVTTASQHTIVVCDVYHAQAGFSVTINGYDYLIVSVNDETLTLVISSATAPAPTPGDTFEMYRPVFYHGTPIATNTELVQQPDAFAKTPMVWLLETFKDRFYEAPDDARDRDVTARLFFLTQSDHEAWLTGDAYHNAIKPMRRLMEVFKRKLESQPGNYDMTNFKYDAINYAKFGVYVANRGTDKNLFADKLAGVEMSLAPLTIMKAGVCGEGCVS